MITQKDIKLALEKESMATDEELMALLKAHYEKDQDAFTTIALNIGAKQALKGNDSSARAIRKVVDKRKKTTRKDIIDEMNEATENAVGSL